MERNRTTSLRNVTTMSNRCPGKVTAWRMATRSPPSWIDGLVSSIESPCIATRENKSCIPLAAGRLGMAQGSSQVSSQETHIRGPNPMRRWSAWPSFPIPTHLHEGPINCRRQRPIFFLPLPHAIPYPPFPLQPAPVQACGKATNGLSSLTRAPRISNASLTALRRLSSTHARSVPSPCPWLPGPSASQPAPILPVRRRPHASRNAHACLGCLADYSAR